MHCGQKEHACGMCDGGGVGRQTDRQTAVEAQAGERWTEEKDWDQHCSEVCCSRLTTSQCSPLPPHGLENQRITDFKPTHLETLTLFLDTAYSDSFPFLVFSLRKQIPAGAITGHIKAPVQHDITQRGRSGLHLMRSQINIFQKPVA